MKLSIKDLFKIKDEYFVKRIYTQQLLEDKQKKLKSYPPIVPNDVYVGIEIEVENIAAAFNDPYGVWSYRADGSLRNSGVEWVSVPLKGPEIVAGLVDFFERIPHNYHFSPRTSIHFHFDVRDKTLDQLKSIVLTYLAVEPLLYKFVGGDRDKNVFCVPLWETYLVNDLSSFIEKRLIRESMQETRYAGLNLDAIRKFGTIEFRQLGGTDDLNKILTWINLLMRVYQFGLVHPNVLKTIVELNTNSFYIGFLNDVFGQLVHVLNISDVKNDLEKGVKAVKQSILNNKLLTLLQKTASATSPAYQWFEKNGYGLKKRKFLLDPDLVRVYGASRQPRTPEQAQSTSSVGATISTQGFPLHPMPQERVTYWDELSPTVTITTTTGNES